MTLCYKLVFTIVPAVVVFDNAFVVEVTKLVAYAYLVLIKVHLESFTCIRKYVGSSVGNEH